MGFGAHRKWRESGLRSRLLPPVPVAAPLPPLVLPCLAFVRLLLVWMQIPISTCTLPTQDLYPPPSVDPLPPAAAAAAAARSQDQDPVSAGVAPDLTLSPVICRFRSEAARWRTRGRPGWWTYRP